MVVDNYIIPYRLKFVSSSCVMCFSTCCMTYIHIRRYFDPYGLTGGGLPASNPRPLKYWKL